MSNFTNALKNGFGSLEAELEAGILNVNKETENFDESNIDGTDYITTDADLTGVDEDNLFDINDDEDMQTQTNTINTEPEASFTDNFNMDKTESDSNITGSNEEELIAETDEDKLILEAYMEIWELLKEWKELTKEEKKEITKGKDILDFSPVKALGLMEDWKESKRIHIGDIITNGKVTGICVSKILKETEDKEYYLISTGDESLISIIGDEAIKTNKHIDIKGLI